LFRVYLAFLHRVRGQPPPSEPPDPSKKVANHVKPLVKEGESTTGAVGTGAATQVNVISQFTKLEITQGFGSSSSASTSTSSSSISSISSSSSSAVTSKDVDETKKTSDPLNPANPTTTHPLTMTTTATLPTDVTKARSFFFANICAISLFLFFFVL
jgi:hypothetical protein